MAIFGPKPWVIPLGKMSTFDFLNFLFLSIDNSFFVLEYHSKHFPGPYCLNKKSWKNGHFWTKNHRLTPLEKCEFFDFWTSFFFSLEKRFFVLQYRKRHFPGLYCLKKKSGKLAILGPKPWVNPFGKTSIFRLFDLPFFIG